MNGETAEFSGLAPMRLNFVAPFFIRTELTRLGRGFGCPIGVDDAGKLELAGGFGKIEFVNYQDAILCGEAGALAENKRSRSLP